MIKLAKIISIDDSKAILNLEYNSQCKDCTSHCSDGFLDFIFHKRNQGVIQVALNKSQEHNSHLVDVNDFFSSDYKRNDIVGIKFNQSQLLKMALILYGLPIILIILLLFVGTIIFGMLNLNQDLGGIIGLILGLVFAKFIIKINQSKFKPKVEFFK